MSGFGQNQLGQQGGYSTNGTNGYGGAYGQGGFQQQNPFAQGGMFSQSFGGNGNGPQQGARMNPGAYGNPYADQLQQGSGNVGQQSGNPFESNSSGLAMNGGSGGGLSNYLSGATYGGGQGPGHPTMGNPGMQMPHGDPMVTNGRYIPGQEGGDLGQTGGNMLYPGGIVPPGNTTPYQGTGAMPGDPQSMIGQLTNRNPQSSPWQQYTGQAGGDPYSAAQQGQAGSIFGSPMSGGASGGGIPTMANPSAGGLPWQPSTGGGDPMNFGGIGGQIQHGQFGYQGPDQGQGNFYGNPTTSQGMYNQQAGQLGFPSIWQGMGYK